jgi:hypothetical protein
VRRCADTCGRIGVTARYVKGAARGALGAGAIRGPHVDQASRRIWPLVRRASRSRWASAASARG